ncbi:MAG: hypothetical protein KKD73_00550, partial [Proteobacteria bacterium]|nr:hypothetical protein [Pseudomonadota bacterium]MBU1640985.1 hypothetical protein [Pseudomonadota bacterium]
SEISGNTINCNPAYPSKIPANDVGRVLASTLTNTAGNYLNVNTGIITTDATWPAKLPLHILGNITVQGVDGADGITTLTIEPGVEVRFNLYTQLIIGASSGAPGSLVAQGTIGNPILFTSNQVTPAPGNWYGVRFHATSPTSSILENAIVEYANYNIVVSATSPTILNTKSRFASIAGVYLYGAATTSAILGCLDISDNAYGFHVSYANPIISGHNIVNNSSAGLYVFGSNIDDATNNWWGDAGGPGVNGANIVTGTATVAPWLTAAKSCDQVINEPPETPHTPQPSDVSVRVPLASGNVTLSWLTTDPNTGDTVFSDIYMGADPESLSLLTGGLATKSYTTPLAEGMTYYWQVVAKDYEFSSSGPIWSFTTDGPPPDLIVNSFTSQPQGNVNVGDTITFTATITNQGAGPVVDSSTMELGMDGVAIAIDNIDTILMNGATVQISGTWVYAIGDHTLSATVDPLDTVVEADEANNSLSMTVADLLDQEPPQLISTLPVANSYAQQAETFTFTLYDRHRHIDDAAVIAAFSLIGPGSLPVPGTISENNDTFIFTPAGSFAQGTYNATILAQDIVGYIVNYQIPFVLDGVPPEPPVITGGTMASGLVQIRPVLNSAEALSFTLTGEREADTSVFIDSVEQIPLGQDILWSSVLFLTPGPNSFAVRLRDAAGNLSDEVWVDIIAESTDRLEMLYDASGRIKQIVKP